MILKNTSDLKHPPKRIISLVPSQTELLFDLGLETETIGITKFCVHPLSWFKTKERVGGTKTLNIDKIHQLKPDLIIANKEENVKEQVEELALHYPVWLTDVNNLEDALQMITDIGQITRKHETALNLKNKISRSFRDLKQAPASVNTAYLIWRNPYMTVGGDTFIHDMLIKCGFRNIFSDQARYPEINIPELKKKNLELLLLSSEPYPFKQKHIDELSTRLAGTKIILADGEMFSWYGSRLLLSAAYFEQLIQQIQAN